jgi:hypothetical protein
MAGRFLIRRASISVMEDIGFTPSIFDGLVLSEQEKATVDAFRAAWDRDPNKALDDLLCADPRLVLNAMDHAIGYDAVRRLFQDVMDERGMTVDDLRANLALAIKRLH